MHSVKQMKNTWQSYLWPVLLHSLKAWLIFVSSSCRWSLWSSTRVEHIWLLVDQTSEFISANSGLRSSTSLVSWAKTFLFLVILYMKWNAFLCVLLSCVRFAVVFFKNVVKHQLSNWLFFLTLRSYVLTSLAFFCRSLWSGDRCGFRWTCSVPGFQWHGQKSQILQPVIEMENLQERCQTGCDHFPTANMSVSNKSCMCIHRYTFTVIYIIIVMNSSETYSIPDFEFRNFCPLLLWQILAD